jgi:hypothetical protein
MAQTLADLDDGAAAAIPLRVRALTLFGMMNWIYTWYDPDGPMSPNDLAEYFTAIATPGAATVAGT